jgi:stage II sporulation protein D
MSPMKYLSRAIALGLAIWLVSCGPPPTRIRSGTPDRQRIPAIRVGLVTGQATARAGGTGKFRVQDLATGENISEDGRGKMWLAKAQGAWIDMVSPDGESAGLYSGPVRFQPLEQGGRIWVAGQEYRGVVDIVPEAGQLNVVNEVDLENYLRGVVPVEIGRLKASQVAAVKAQAIAARTYALANRGRRRSRGFDIYASVEDQVYQGFGVETKLSDLAIAETHGLVGSYKGKMISPFYSSTCGGRTESIDEAWDSPAVAYLRSIKDEGRGGVFCEPSPVYRWVVEWQVPELERILTTTLPSRGRQLNGPVALRDLRIRKRSASGRVKELEIKTQSATFNIRGDEVRRVLRRAGKGNPLLRSTLFSLKIVKDRQGRPRKVIANGGGFGHGIGLCQYGAIAMASRGYRFDQILTHYYRGIKIRRLY